MLQCSVRASKCPLNSSTRSLRVFDAFFRIPSICCFCIFSKATCAGVRLSSQRFSSSSSSCSLLPVIWALSFASFSRLPAPRLPRCSAAAGDRAPSFFSKFLDFYQIFYSPKPIEINLFNVHWSRVAQFLVFGFLSDTDFLASDVN